MYEKSLMIRFFESHFFAQLWLCTSSSWAFTCSKTLVSTLPSLSSTFWVCLLASRLVQPLVQPVIVACLELLLVYTSWTSRNVSCFTHTLWSTVIPLRPRVLSGQQDLVDISRMWSEAPRKWPTLWAGLAPTLVDWPHPSSPLIGQKACFPSERRFVYLGRGEGPFTWGKTLHKNRKS